MTESNIFHKVIARVMGPPSALPQDIEQSGIEEAIRAATETRDLLLRYSEWLDVQGLMKKPKKGDTRTHDDLAGEFMEYEA